MLFPSQEQAKQALRQSFETNPLTLLEGLSGSGKSHIAEQVVAEAGRGEIIEGGA
jgi:adenylylsulfate kinase-like enzyme